MENEERLDRKEENKLSPYAIFHLSNIGWYWRKTKGVEYIDKGMMYASYWNNPAALEELTKGYFNGYIRERKEAYKPKKNQITDIPNWAEQMLKKDRDMWNKHMGIKNEV